MALARASVVTYGSLISVAFAWQLAMHLGSCSSALQHSMDMFFERPPGPSSARWLPALLKQIWLVSRHEVRGHVVAWEPRCTCTETPYGLSGKLTYLDLGPFFWLLELFLSLRISR